MICWLKAILLNQWLDKQAIRWLDVLLCYMLLIPQ